MENHKLSVPVTIPYLLMFLLLTFLCYQAHEFFHHLTGALLCGGFGSMSFTVFEPRSPCSSDTVVTLAGPLLSFVIAWAGAYGLVKQKQMLLSYTLIFASFAHLRFPLPLMKSGDEWSVVRTHFEQPNALVLAAVLFLMALPPLVVAYRSIANRGRLLIFIASWLLPFIILFALPMLDERLFGADLNNAAFRLVGIPFAVVLANFSATVLLVITRKYIFPPFEPSY